MPDELIKLGDGNQDKEEEEKEEKEAQKDGEVEEISKEKQEKLDQLEQDLERERTSVKLQGEKLNNVKNEFDMMNARFIQITTENKSLSDKVALMETNLINAEINQLENQDEYIEKLEKKINGLKEENEIIRQQSKTKAKKEQGEEVHTTIYNVY